MKNIDEEFLKKLLAERDQLISENPSLIPIQGEYNRRMKKCGNNQMARVAEAFYLLGDICTNELVPELENLKELLSEVEKEALEKFINHRKQKTG